MTLHKRTLLAIGLTLAGLITALYVSSQAIVLDSFARQEEQDSRLNVERVELRAVWPGCVRCPIRTLYDRRN